MRAFRPPFYFLPTISYLLLPDARIAHDRVCQREQDSLQREHKARADMEQARRALRRHLAELRDCRSHLPAAAQDAAGGKDVRIGGGATVVRDFLAAGLIDRLHVAIVPILLGRGIRLWDDLRGLEQQYKVTTEAAASGTVHVTFSRPAGNTR